MEVQSKSKGGFEPSILDGLASSENQTQSVASGEPDFYVYIDESQKSKTFTLSAIFIAREKLTPLREEWDALRRRIKKVLLETYSLAAQNQSLQGDGLPEIHAVDMFLSDGYYRKHEKGTNVEDKYWEEHFVWMEDALKIIQRHEIPFLSAILPQSEREKFTQTARESFVQLFDRIDSGREIKKKSLSIPNLYSLTDSDYFFAMPGFLLEIEAYLRERGKTGEIICDQQNTHDLGKRFSSSQAISWLQEQGSYKHITAPRFRRSVDEVGLQACDLLSYVAVNFSDIAVNHLIANEPLTRMKPTLGRWFVEYVMPLVMREERELVHPSRVDFLISTDMLIDFCVLDDYVKSEMKQIARRLTPVPLSSPNAD